MAYARLGWACHELLEAAAQQLASVSGDEALQILAPSLVSLSRLRWRHPLLERRTLEALRDLQVEHGRRGLKTLPA